MWMCRIAELMRAFDRSRSVGMRSQADCAASHVKTARTSFSDGVTSPGCDIGFMHGCIAIETSIRKRSARDMPARDRTRRDRKRAVARKIFRWRKLFQSRVARSCRRDYARYRAALRIDCGDELVTLHATTR